MILSSLKQYLTDLTIPYFISTKPEESVPTSRYKKEVRSAFGSTQLSESSTEESELEEEEEENQIIPTIKRSSSIGWKLAQLASSQTIKKSRSKSAFSTFDHQLKLPRLPVPDLDSTLKKYWASVQVSATNLPQKEEILNKTNQAIEQFKKSGIGAQLQNLLLARNQTQCPSWLEEFWDDAYLYGRDSTALNVNYYFVLKNETLPERNDQIFRAAALLSGLASFKLLLDNNELDPDMERDTPLDMSQYHRIFGACRIPAENRDYIVHYTKWRPSGMSALSKTVQTYVDYSPRHIVVVYRNHFYSFNIFNENFQILKICDIMATLRAILEEVHSFNDEDLIPWVFFKIFFFLKKFLTTLNRNDWANAREKLIGISLENKDNLKVIESALFLLCLDNFSPSNGDETSRIIFHGPCQNRFFDKHQLIVCSNGVAGINFEHSVGDGTTTLRMTDAIFKYSIDVPLTSEKGESQMISRLMFTFDIELKKRIEQAYNSFKEDILATETKTMVFRQFGGLFIKDCNLSPDATVQVAMQLAFYILCHDFAPTYEAASTKKFLHGRTETVRSLTSQVVNFCQIVAHRPLLDKQPSNQLWDLLNEAVNTHVQVMRAAKEGQGIDRHLYGLSMIHKKHFPNQQPPELFVDPMYLKSSRWILSTSHCGSPALQFFGFGPVANDGYGIGYMIKNDEISFNITSKFSNHTSSQLLALALEQALLHIKAIILSKQESLSKPPNSLSFIHPTSSAEIFLSPNLQKTRQE